jgi:hypothetical protein
MGYSLGAAEYLTKPIDPERRSATVQRFKHGAGPSRVIAARCEPNLLPQPARASLVGAGQCSR